MFAQALKTVIPFTQPVILSKRFADGSVDAGCAAFIIVNPDGWMLTAGHVLQDFLTAQQHTRERQEYEQNVQEIQSDNRLTAKKKRQATTRLPKNRLWITNHSYWWAHDSLKIENFVIDSLADLATGQLKPYKTEMVSNYPIFKNPKSELPVGTSLCRLGFPLHKIEATFDESTGSFHLPEGVLPLPRFPLEGIHTRVAMITDEKATRQAKFIETSSPGLRGQSGGPVFDVSGNI